MKQSFSGWCFENRGADYETLFRSANEIGYRGVELIPTEKIELAIDCGLEIVSHNGHTSIESGLNDLSNHDRILSEIDKNLELAARYKIHNLIVFSGNRRSDLNDIQGMHNVAKALSRAARSAEEAGVTLIIELLNSKIDHHNYQCDRTEWAVNAIKSVNSPNVKVLYDIYHMQVMEGDLIRTINHYAASIGHYHTAGNPGRNDLDGDQEINYPAVFKAIAATGYDGYISHEFIPKGDPIAALKSAYSFTEESWLQSSMG